MPFWNLLLCGALFRRLRRTAGRTWAGGRDFQFELSAIELEMESEKLIENAVGAASRRVCLCVYFLGRDSPDLVSHDLFQDNGCFV